VRTLPTRVVIYCRISGWSQAGGDGLRRQLSTCVAFAHRHGLEVVAVFSEVASGAGPLDARKQAQRVAKAQGAFLLVEDASRWSRGRDDAMPLNVYVCSDPAIELEERLRELISGVIN